ALLEIGGEPLITWLVAALADCCDEVLLVGGDPARFAGLGLPACWVPDAVPDVGPLGGILGALQAAHHDACLVVACDMPRMTHELLRVMAARPRDYSILAYSSDEPLLAIYTRACLDPLRSSISPGQ